MKQVMNTPPRPLASASFLLLCTLSAAALLLAKGSSLAEPYYWDAVGCYMPQARELARHGLNLAGYRGLPFIRPPLYTGVLALFMDYVSESRLVLHTVTIVWGALTLPAVYAICRALGGGRAAGLLALALCALSPTYFAQLGMVQTDLPATTLCAWAWLLVLYGRRAGFAALASLAVLTKESSIFICLPAALLIAIRHTDWLMQPTPPPSPARARLARGRLLPFIGSLLYAWPTAVPALVLLLWLMLHRALTGHLVAADHLEAILSLPTLSGALLHSFVESGRPLLLAAACPAVLPALRGGAEADGRRWEVLMTALGVLVLPLVFSAGLPRYMLLSLPLLCALGGLGLQRLTREQRLGATVLLGAALLLGWHGDSFHDNSGYHLERNLEYKALLRLHQQLARELATQRPSMVLAAFPATAILTAPPTDGYLQAPIPARFPLPGETLATLCQSDFLVEADGGSVETAKAQLAAVGALTPWKVLGESDEPVGSRRFTPRWARVDHRLRIYKVACPAARPARAAASATSATSPPA
jgi:hypothetical protein